MWLFPPWKTCSYDDEEIPWNMTVHHSVHKSPFVEHIFSQLHLVDILTPYFKTSFNIILPVLLLQYECYDLYTFKNLL
jgi:hypothetical protein